MADTLPVTDNRVESYLARLSAALVRLPQAEREDILREIRAHVLDSTAGATDREGSVERVLRLLGTPEELGQRYLTECLLSRAGHSFSPLFLLRTSCQWAKLGIKGTVAFFLALLGYGTALALTVAVLMKPLLPSIGMWVGSRGLNLGMPANTEGMHEVLGNNFIPVIALCAFAIGVGTTQALRWLIRKHRPKTAN